MVVDDVFVLLVVDCGPKTPPRPALLVGGNVVDTAGSVGIVDSVAVEVILVVGTGKPSVVAVVLVVVGAVDAVVDVGRENVNVLGVLVVIG